MSIEFEPEPENHEDQAKLTFTKLFEVTPRKEQPHLQGYPLKSLTARRFGKTATQIPDGAMMTNRPRKVQATIRRSDRPFPEKAIGAALLQAHSEFVMRYGRAPNYDFVTFSGGFSTAHMILELTEEAY